MLNNVKSKIVMDKNMKKTFLASLTVAAALASAPFANANSYLELISGTSTVQTTIAPNNVTLTSVMVGSWSLGITATGTGSGTPFLVANLQGVDNEESPTMGLTIIYSSGSYNYGGQGAIFGLTANGSSLDSTGSLFTSSALYTGSGSLGTQFMSTLTESANPGAVATSEAGPLAANPAMYVTEELTFGGGASVNLSGAAVNINGTASVTTNVPDGGLTMVMLGSSILLLAGIRSRFSKKS